MPREPMKKVDWFYLIACSGIIYGFVYWFITGDIQ
jgi:hypothetical protein